jgi:hypothetical protein
MQKYGISKSDALNGKPGANRHLVARKRLVAPVNERSNLRRKTGEFSPPEETVKHVRGHGMPRFDFYRVETICFFDQEVDFVSSPVAPKENRRCLPMVQIGLGDLGDHVVLKNRTPERMRNDLGSLTDTQELAEYPCIVEVELGAFDHPLV